MIVLEPPAGEAAGLADGLSKAGLSRFLGTAQRALQLHGEITVLLADDARLKSLNRCFRGKNKPTDVLSFSAGENGEGVVGDLAISLETAARQAAEHGHALAIELRVLLLHGVLHLAGYDHETDHGEMRDLEQQLRTRFRLPGGLIERTTTPTLNRRKPNRRAAP